MNLENYFDNAATTPVDPRVRDAMLPWLGEHCGNPHSLHSWGSEAMHAVERAREQVAQLIGADDPAEIVFTSGATEANNWILRSFSNVAVSPFEHSSIYETAKALGHRIMKNNDFEVIPEDAELLSLMKVNNEIGAIFFPEKLVGKSLLHSDITQAVGKIRVQAPSFDFATFSAHKFYGPKGVGALYAKNGHFPSALLLGGEQESSARAGTLNVPAIVGMGAAAALAIDQMEHDYAHAVGLQQVFADGLRGVTLGGFDYSHFSPFILAAPFKGIQGETLVIEMDRLGFAISSGAACSSRSTEPSHVLTALGLEPETIRGAIRISFGRFNTRDSAYELGKNLAQAVKNLANLGV